MRDTAAVILPVQPGRRPRKSARRAVHRRKARMAWVRAALFLLLAILAAGEAGHALSAWGGTPAGGVCGAVELIRQNPELPNGCETASMAMALGAAGWPVDKLTLYGYLPQAPIMDRGGRRFGPNPEDAYAGDAASLTGGWYCLEGPVIQAANCWLEHQGSGRRARSVTGLSQAELDRYAQDGIPVVVWVTLDYAAPQWSTFTWLLEDGTVYQPYSNLHCVVLAGTRNGRYQIADPIDGFVLVDKDTFWSSFSAMGCRAAVIKGASAVKKITLCPPSPLPSRSSAVHRAAGPGRDS